MKIIYPTILLLLLFYLSSCSLHKKTNHPPSYSEVIHNSELLLNNLDDCSFSDLGSSIEFSDADQCRIVQEGNPKQLLASAISSHSSWLWWRNNSLINIEDLGINEKLIYYQHLIIKDLFMYDNESRSKYNLSYYEKLSDKLIEIDSENSYPYYLKSILLYSFTSDINSSLKLIKKGNNLNKYNDYSKIKYELIKDTALFLNYSPFTARYYANMKSEYGYFTVPPRILTICESVKDVPHCNTCIEAGLKIESDGLISGNQLIGQSIQLKSSCSSNNENIEERRIKLRDKLEKIMNLKLNNNIEEHRYIQLIEDIYSKGEIKAYDLYFTNK